MTLTQCLRAAEAAARPLDPAAADRLADRRLGLTAAGRRVAVFGEFSRGKSTLINALLGRPLLQAKLVPTTGHVTRVVHDPAEVVEVRYHDGRTELLPLDRVGEATGLDPQCQARADVAAVTVRVAAPLLAAGLTFLDTPGVGEQAAQTRRAERAVAEADVVLLVLSAQQVLTGPERELAAGWMTDRLGKPVVPVLNFMGVVDPGQRADVRAVVAAFAGRLKSPFPRPWYEVDALTAVRHAVRGGPLPADDFAALRAALAGLCGPAGEAVAAASRAAQVRADVRTIRAENAGLLTRLEADAATLTRERQAAQANRAARAARFAADARLARQAVETAARKRLHEQRDGLIGRLAGKDRATLEGKANGWYADRLTDALRRAEKDARAALHDLAGDDLARPDPLTVVEERTLAGRLTVGALATVEADDATVGRGAVIGGIIGTVLAPGAGTVAGAAFGAWVANWFGSSEPDYAAAYQAKAGTAWDADAATAVASLLSQFDARVTALRSQLTELRPVPAADPPAELAARREFDRLLADCERLTAN
jgi:hypothetical protein